ncbi:hypothetical protein DH2020_005728 [Rehmannia glutinosa]|uniref:beta-ketoacyl-[acyl-carrier-protein] synthase I n=1 Tax=Rehmannia glutinosa TaxID=99300 RepID=A0ABR0XGV2_REHGL
MDQIGPPTWKVARVELIPIRKPDIDSRIEAGLFLIGKASKEDWHTCLPRLHHSFTQEQQELNTFYNKLLDGVSGIAPIDRFDASEFPKALDDANLGKQVLDTLDKTKIGVLVGSGMGGISVFSNGVEALVQKGYKKITPFFIPYSITNMGSALLAIDTGLMGPNYSISTACATANYCFYAAANHIRRGDAEIMVAGGTEGAIIPTGVGGFIACRALSQRNEDPQKASRPWDKNRDGFVMGEGAGVLVMESLDHAMKRGANIIAEYLGGAITCDAHHMTDPRSDGLGVSSCIIKSLEDAGVSPEEVNYVNAHATSTLAGDLAEVNAIKKVFKDTSEIKMNGTKDLEPDVTIDTVPNVKKQHQVNVAISNSFGFGGHNSVVVFAPFKP